MYLTKNIFLKYINFSIIAWSIKHNRKFRKSKKIDFWGSHLIDDRLIEKKSTALVACWIYHRIFKFLLVSYYRFSFLYSQDVQKSFFLMLLLIIIGEFFSAPAITLVDSAVITLLGEDADRYGHQRMFGSLGWGLSMFFLGIALDRSTAFTNYPCGIPGEREKNYRICFFAFSVLMGGALISATQITFRYNDDYEKEKEDRKPSVPKEDDSDAMEQEVARQLNLPFLASSHSTNTAVPRKPIPRIQNENQQLPNVGKVSKLYGFMKNVESSQRGRLRLRRTGVQWPCNQNVAFTLLK